MLLAWTAAAGCADFNASSLYLGFLDTSAWWDQTWLKRIKLTLDSSANGTALANFPALVKLNSSRISYSDFQSSGQDVRFIDADGTTVLSHEVGAWNAAGESRLWVRIPQIDASSSSDYIYMYYGNTSATSIANASGVWSENYAAVWHLNEDPSGAAPQIADSSGNGHSGTSAGAMMSSESVTGAVGNALVFDGTNNAINMSAACLVAGTWTVSMWVYPSSPANFGRLFTLGSTGCASRQIMMLWHGSDVEVRTTTGGSSGAPQGSTPTLADSTWSHLTWTYDGTTHLFFVNGTAGTGTTGSTSLGITATMCLGCRNSDRYFTGRLDETRVSTVARSADWVATQYKSTSDTLFTYGTAESR